MKFFGSVIAIIALASGAFATSAVAVDAAMLPVVFTAATTFVSESPANPNIDDEDRLAFYANFKQATVGPCTTAAPGMFNLVALAKWNAWMDLGAKTKEQAMQDYIALLTSKVPAWSS